MGNARQGRLDGAANGVLPIREYPVDRNGQRLLDLMQPGWRAALVARRFLPHLTVSHALVTAAQGGTAGRPGPAVPDVPGLYVAGDWVGPEGMLADASLASARQAARLILQTGDSAGNAGIGHPRSLSLEQWRHLGSGTDETGARMDIPA